MTFNWASIPSLLVVVVFALGIYTAKDWTMQAGLFPLAIGIPALVLALVQLFLDAARGRKGAHSGDTALRADLAVDHDVPVSQVVRRAGVAFAWIFGLGFGIWALGFMVAVPLFTFLYLFFQGRERWWLAVAFTLFLSLFQYVVFDRIIHTNWPKGAIYQWIDL